MAPSFAWLLAAVDREVAYRRHSVGVDRADTQQQELETKIISMVRSVPGFVHGYWTEDAETGKLHSFIVFGDEAGARFLKGVVEGNSQAQARVGISYDSLSIVEVKASAYWQGRRESS